MNRLIVLDTETTGLDVNDGHRIIEIGCIEIINRTITNNSFHKYINPDRPIDEGAQNVHGISLSMLEDKPKFYDIVEELLEYLGQSDLIIHNAPFDLGFLKRELDVSKKDGDNFIDQRKIIDTLTMSRKKFPGKRNTLDALCARFNVDNTERSYHGALLDANLLASVYLKMTRGQTSLKMVESDQLNTNSGPIVSAKIERKKIIISASEDETRLHNEYFKN